MSLLPSVLWSVEYHAGSVLANYLGLQVARTLVANAAFHLHPRTATPEFFPHVQTFEQDGILVIPDFLPRQVFEAIQAECRAARRAGVFRVDQCTEDNEVLEDSVAVDKKAKSFPMLRTHVAENPWLRSFGSHILRRPELPAPSLVVSIIRKADRPVTPSRLIGTNYLHADVHFPTIKGWLYLSDVDEHNGAFVFARGSHCLSLARLLYEHEASIRVAKANRDGTMRTAVPYGLIRTPTARQLARMKIRAASICGKANTLVVATTMGFHRRGEFMDRRPREVVNILFKRFVFTPARQKAVQPSA